jgi:hypothetical protein
MAKRCLTKGGLMKKTLEAVGIFLAMLLLLLLAFL